MHVLVDPYLGNLFVTKDSEGNPGDFRYGAIDVERDPTKSYFNYLWINIRAGIFDTVTGNGKKESD